MSSEPFVHLHVHSEFSLLDGASKIDEVVKAAADDGQSALATTDHGNMYSVVPFYQACQKHGVSPIIGTELYMAKESRDERPKRRNKNEDDSGGEAEGGGKINYHLTALAENNEGYKNLIQLSSRAFLEGYYYKPRVDWELLNEHSKGVIVTSGCLGGQVLQALLQNDTQGAEQIGGRLQDIFGKDNFFIEIQDHGIPAQRQTFQQLIDLAKTLDAPLLATNDSHYTHREGAVGHDSLLCVQTKTVLSDPDRFKFESDQHYLKSAEEMRYLFREIPTSCDNTLLIAERAKVEINFNELHLPEFPIPDGFADADAYLADLVLRGAAERWNVTDEVISRLVYELRIIQDMGFASYFLIVWDLCRHAREAGIRVGPGRGSAAGAAVAYALQITEIDPLKHGLLFERFLNPSRISMPDIDLDLSTRFRDHMIEYCAAKYGQDHVAQIITFSQIKARAAVRDSARVLGVPYAVGDKISKALPPALQGRDAPLAASFDLDERFPAAYAASGPLRALADTDPEVRKVISIARGLEGLRRSDGVHAAAVVVSDKPITEYVPIQRKGADEPIVTQYEMHAVEELGLLKMDFLGLKNLDIIDECLRLMANSGIVIEDINQIPLDDQPTFDLLRSGNTTGVFQLESRGMQDLLKRLRPTKFGDVAAVLALYRPGPMGANMHNDYADRKNRKQAVSYYYPAAEEILQDTYGLMIYQEDVMRLSQQFAGYTLPEADNLRKAMGKKLPALMAEHNDKFVNGALVRGYDEQLARHLFGVIDKFADYGFNKCIAGSSVIQLGGANQYFDGTIKVEDLYKRANTVGVGSGPSCLWCETKPAKKKGLCYGCAAWHQKFHKGGIKALAMDVDGRIRPKPIKGVHSNGWQDTWRITLEDGRSITATHNHRHLTPKGWVRVDELYPGDELVTHVGVDEVSGMSLADLRTTIGGRQLVGAVNHAFGSQNYGYVDGGFSKFKENSSRLPKGCQNDSSHHGRFEVAHLDGDRTNNEISNLRRLCVSCHKKHDYRANDRKKRFDKGHLAGSQKIISIEFGGLQATYDLEMDDPGHNFVANGILTHNSHAYGYGLIAYQTAYLKANYPTYYMAALCTYTGDVSAQAVALAEAKRMGIPVRLPSINHSYMPFTASPTEIRVGLGSILSIGEKFALDIVRIREQDGPYKDVFDFCFRMKMAKIRTLTTKSFQMLADSGAFDEFGFSRMGLSAIRDEILKAATKQKDKAVKGQISMFDDEIGHSYEVPEAEYSQWERLGKEKENMGLYVSGHPMDGMESWIEAHSKLHTGVPTDRLDGVEHLPDETTLDVVGVVTAVEERTTRAGDKMANIVIEDQLSSLKIVSFAKTWKKVAEFTKVGRICTFRVRVNTNSWGEKAVIMLGGDFCAAQMTERVREEGTLFRLYLPDPVKNNDFALSRMKGMLLSHRGPTPVALHYGMNAAMRLPDDYAVKITPELVEDCRLLFTEFMEV